MASVGTSNDSRSSGDPSTSSSQSIQHDIYLYEMPVIKRRDLCVILDQSGHWEDLAERVGYTKTDINVSYSGDFFVSCFVI